MHRQQRRVEVTPTPTVTGGRSATTAAPIPRPPWRPGVSAGHSDDARQSDGADPAEPPCVR